MKPTSRMSTGEGFRQCVGIDISKEKFTACLYMYDRLSDEGCCTGSVEFANTRQGFNQMVKWSRKEALKGRALTYLMEPTGVYYEPLAYHLDKIGQTLYVVLPNKARKFCEAEGIKTKTDAMDARSLALMGCASRKLRPWSPPKAIYRELRQLTRFRADLCKLREELVSEIDKLMEKNEKDITAKLAEDKELEARINRIATAKGVGATTITCVVAETQGFHLIENRKQLTSYAGLDVKAKQSGKEDPKHTISKKGNANIRAVLYMPAMSAARCNRQAKAAYDRICQKHPKEKMIGITAVMRRLLLLIYTLWKNGEEYDETRDVTSTPRKKDHTPDHTQEYCIPNTNEPVDWNATGENGQPPF